MSHTRKFKRKHPAKPTPKPPQVRPYPLMASVDDALRAIPALGCSVGPTTHVPVPYSEIERSVPVFDSFIRSIGTMLALTDEQVGTIEKLAIDLARVTGMPAVQTAQSLLVLAECGLSMDEIVSRTVHAYPQVRNAVDKQPREVAIPGRTSGGSAKAILALASIVGLGVR